MCARTRARVYVRVCVFELFVAARTRSFKRKRRKKSLLRCALQASPCARTAIVTIMITVMMNVLRVSCAACVMCCIALHVMRGHISLQPPTFTL